MTTETVWEERISALAKTIDKLTAAPARYAELLADEPQREFELKSLRESAREVIRTHKTNYPEISV